MEFKSIWLDNIKLDSVDAFNEDLLFVDVLIIGGGITGLSTAYHLINSNLKVCLVEKNLVGHGVTARTTGKLTFLQENIYSKLKASSIEKSKLYLESQIDAIKTVKDIVEKNNIDCNLEEVKSYLFTDNIDEIDKIKEEAKTLKELGIKVKSSKSIPLKIKSKYAISVDDTYTFHPIKYILELKKIVKNSGIKIYENSKVTNIFKNDDKYECIVNNKKIVAKKIILATHYPFFLFPYLFPLKTYIEKSYLSASLKEDVKKFSAITISSPVKSVRYYNNYLMYLNGSHNLCMHYNYKDNFNNLIDDVKKLKLNPSFVWSNHDIITYDKIPYIGYIDDNLLIGTGFNTWGMTNGSIAGVILSDLVLNKENKYQSLFDPKRNGFTKVIKYPLNMVYTSKSLIQNKLSKNKTWYSDSVKFLKKDGKDIAIYKDSNNKEHIVYNKCPHLKCSLLFNEKEKTWDCPCHGSRFDIDGKSIMGPSNYDISYKD